MLREYTRVGFNKILMGPMKLNLILTHLCEAPDSRYFKTAKVVPPANKKVTVIVRKAEDEKIREVYKNEFRKIMEKSQNSLEENVIKKSLFTALLPEGIPPLNQVMKDKKMSFSDLLTKFLGENTSKVIF